ncbi:MAG: UDP-N-acetylglucosamine pyrophosphorylase [Lachnospiraceae bacterium]|nr:UDP-N-acetylglucosamine pyrophosphorylase [Lachnospiraceae bacterium]
MAQQEQVKIRDLFTLEETIAKEYLEQFTYPWEALGGIHDLICEIGPKLPKELYEQVAEDVWIARSAKVFDSAYIGGACIIGENTQVRQCAFIRGDALVGNNCVVGNSAELKNVIIFNNCETPHYNYVGDSILGFHAHMGAGSITSNIKADRTNIIVKGDEEYVTGRRKIGAILGDWVEVGCNAVLNPGTVVGQRSMIYPTSCVRGIVKSDTIWKNTGEQIAKTDR